MSEPMSLKDQLSRDFDKQPPKPSLLDRLDRGPSPASNPIPTAAPTAHAVAVLVRTDEALTRLERAAEFLERLAETLESQANQVRGRL